MMKRKVFMGTLATALVLGGAFAVGATNNESNLVEATNKNEMITVEEAGKVALQEVDGKVESIELESKRDKVVYEVEVEKGHIDYDVYVDAHTGELYSVKQDDDFNDDNSITYEKVDLSAANGNLTQTNEGTISQAEAVKFAEKAVNGKMHEIEKDEDDGFFKYEIELKTDRGEAEVEIDAVTGKILEVEFDD
ncbi:PepSY domain-containing protein [Bacillus sp. V3B]|uniref:PepSY domain-containing protein n=1 Tax=Bacillus sp. V3B TaxID=2804915 RepID=UPI00210A6717|nr:PepSY domain-containing protein [Bacillus sp. V3B]MCQ6274471.1 PepSY domain-containing protein [Bacillus sp. V3B]